MITLDEGNVLLKPSHRRQIMSGLKRATRLGDRAGDLRVSISMKRTGRLVQLEADVATRRGAKIIGSRQNDWRDAFRELSRRMTSFLHDQVVHPAVH